MAHLKKIIWPSSHTGEEKLLRVHFLFKREGKE